MSSLRELFGEGRRLLSDVSKNDAAFEAKQLLLSAFSLTETEYILQKDSPADAENERRYVSLLQRRLSGEPLQYILGVWNFCGFDFQVGAGVLIPRPETEELVFFCADRIRKKGYKTVFDLCSGSGCIGISLALLCPETEVYLFEKYDAALFYLRQNVPEEISGRIHVILSDVLLPPACGLPRPDVIVSNPPYIKGTLLPTLPPEVLREPSSALDGGADGLDFYKSFTKHWFGTIKTGGFAAVECGEDQAREIAEIFSDFGSVQQVRDLYGKDRFVILDL